MSNTPTDDQAWQVLLEIPEQENEQAVVGAFARAVLAKWGTQPQAGAVPQGWKAVPVNPTPEMWKAAKTVPDPNPPYPPHYGLVWDAMLAASPTPPAEQQAAPKAAPGDRPISSASAKAAAHVAREFREAAPQQEAQADSQPMPVVDKCTKQQLTTEVLRRMQQQEDGHNKNPFRSLLDRLMRNEGGYSTIEIGQLKYALDGFYGAARAPADSVTAPQQEAQKPVAWFEYNADLNAWFLAYHRNPKAKTRPLVFGDTTPQPAPAPLSDDAFLQIRGALEAARNGLTWFMERHPEDCNSSDDEMLAQIDAAIAAHGITGGQKNG